MRIPILNLYYLLCYAWNKLDEAKIVSVGAESATQLVDLLARVLVSGTEYLLKHGLDRGYLQVEEVTARPRGRIDFSGSIRQSTFSTARLSCAFDELSYDVIHNRILKTTLRQLGASEGLDIGLRSALEGLYRRLSGVSEIKLSSSVFRAVQLNKNNAFYAFLLNVCSLVNEGLLVDEITGGRRFRDFVRDEVAMRAVFQEFVKNFLKYHVGNTYRVTAKVIAWQETTGLPGSLQFMPRIHTDVTLESSERSVIIDTKYSAETFDRPFGAERIRADHLYQIFSYLENYRKMTGQAATTGIVLYPTVDRQVDLRYSIGGHDVRFVTLDLNQPWQNIEADLVSLVN